MSLSDEKLHGVKVQAVVVVVDDKSMTHHFFFGLRVSLSDEKLHGAKVLAVVVVVVVVSSRGPRRSSTISEEWCRFFLSSASADVSFSFFLLRLFSSLPSLFFVVQGSMRKKNKA